MFHERVINPLDILWNPIKEKGKRVAPPSSSSLSSSSDENEVPPFLEFHEELYDNEDLTDAQKEKKGMFKCLNRYFVKTPTYVNLESSSEVHQNEKTPLPPPRKKSLSPPHAPSKYTSSRSTHYTSSSSSSESPTPTHVAPSPKLRFFIPLKQEPQELPPPQTLSPNDPYMLTLLEPIYEPHQVQQNDSNVVSVVSSVEQCGGTVEQNPATVEEIRAYFESLYNNLDIEVEKVNSGNRKMKEINADLTTELASHKNQEKCFEIAQQKQASSAKTTEFV
ncbi:hypothetical protein Tco_0059006 [Tanacetum coccineum]